MLPTILTPPTIPLPQCNNHGTIAFGHKQPPVQLLCFQAIETPLGPLLLGATKTHLCVTEFVLPERLAQQCVSWMSFFPGQAEFASNPILEQAIAELGEYFEGTRTTFDIPMHFPGTTFQQKVWKALLTIPYGETRSYEDIARIIGSGPQACRAVGRANGQNRLCIFIPCHRVINKSGTLGGFGGGLNRKEFLLALEQSIMDRSKQDSSAAATLWENARAAVKKI